MFLYMVIWHKDSDGSGNIAYYDDGVTIFSSLEPLYSSLKNTIKEEFHKNLTKRDWEHIKSRDLYIKIMGGESEFEFFVIKKITINEPNLNEPIACGSTIVPNETLWLSDESDSPDSSDSSEDTDNERDKQSDNDLDNKNKFTNKKMTRKHR